MTDFLANEYRAGLMGPGHVKLLNEGGGGGGGGGANKLINARGLINQRNYSSGTATTSANQYTLDRWRVVASGQALSWADAASVRTMTAPSGGVEQVITGHNILPGEHVLSWSGTATATVNGTSRSRGEAFTLVGGVDAVVRFSGGTFSQPKLEAGVLPTQFDPRPETMEMLLCRFYFWRFTGIPNAGRIFVGLGSGTNEAVFSFQGAMRVLPSGSFSGFSVVRPSAVATLTAITATLNESGLIGFIALGTGIVPGEVVMMRSTGTATYFQFDAEH